MLRVRAWISVRGSVRIMIRVVFRVRVRVSLTVRFRQRVRKRREASQLVKLVKARVFSIDLHTLTNGRVQVPHHNGIRLLFLTLWGKVIVYKY